MEHEFLHSWEGYPDLYDYDQYLTGPIINNEPIGGWCIMAGGPVHPVPILKETSGWIKSNDLTEILPPSLEWPVTIKDYAFDPVNSVYYFGNPAYAGESFYFWRDTGYDYTVTYPYRSNFNRSAPGDGLVIMHADLGANPAGLPQQQRLNSHFIYSIVQADGLHQLEAGENGGDSGDCFPGSRRVTKWNDTTNPSSRWYGQLPSGLSITNIVQEDTQSVVTFLWQPHIVPELRFINPPAGVIMGTGASAYFPLKYEAWDAYGGTTIRLFVIDGATKATNPYGGTEITGSPLTKLPGAVQDNFQVPLTAMPRDGMYYFYAELTPGTSTANGLTENFYSAPRAGRNEQRPAARSAAWPSTSRCPSWKRGPSNAWMKPLRVRKSGRSRAPCRACRPTGPSPAWITPPTTRPFRSASTGKGSPRRMPRSSACQTPAASSRWSTPARRSRSWGASSRPTTPCGS